LVETAVEWRALPVVLAVLAAQLRRRRFYRPVGVRSDLTDLTNWPRGETAPDRRRNVIAERSL
jgi:hypothetical protein